MQIAPGRWALILVALLVVALPWRDSAMAHPYVASIFWQFADGTVLSHIIAQGSKEHCEAAARTPPVVPPPAGRTPVKTWVEVYRAASAMGQE